MDMRTLRRRAALSLALCSMLASLEARAQDDFEVAQCTDACVAAEDACLAGCPDGDEGDACAEDCTDVSDGCIEACEGVE
jgi:hypothetical protein